MMESVVLLCWSQHLQGQLWTIPPGLTLSPCPHILFPREPHPILKPSCPFLHYCLWPQVSLLSSIKEKKSMLKLLQKETLQKYRIPGQTFQQQPEQLYEFTSIWLFFIWAFVWLRLLSNYSCGLICLNPETKPSSPWAVAPNTQSRASRQLVLALALLCSLSNALMVKHSCSWRNAFNSFYQIWQLAIWQCIAPPDRGTPPLTPMFSLS